MSKPQLHPSGIGMYSRCPESFRRRYIEGEIIPPTFSMLRGTAVDRGVTANLESKILTGMLLSGDEVMSITHDAFEQEVSKGVFLTDDDVAEGEEKLRGETLDSAIRLANLHAGHVAPTIEPTHVQRSWALEIDDLPFDLAGTLDIQEKDRIRDTKTAAKSPNADAAEVSLQLTAYSMAIERIDGVRPEVGLDVLVDLKTPKVVQLTSSRTEADYLSLLRRVEIVSQAIEADIFPPTNPDAWWCSAKSCGYHSTCPYVRRPVTIAIGGAK